MANDVEHFFHVLVGYLYIFFGEMFILCPFLIGLFVFLLLSYVSALHILDTGPLSDI